MRAQSVFDIFFVSLAFIGLKGAEADDQRGLQTGLTVSGDDKTSVDAHKAEPRHDRSQNPSSASELSLFPN